MGYLMCNLAIAAYLFIAFSWNLPDSCSLRRAVNCWRGPILYCGLWHGWNMFAPEPLMVNRRLSARIHLIDGSVVEWRAKNLATMKWWHAFLEVRDRKWQDNLMSDKMEYLRPSLTEYLAKQLLDEGLTATKIELVVERRLVPPPDIEVSVLGNFERKVIFTYQVPQPTARASGPVRQSQAA